jgi:hypothetical protein
MNTSNMIESTILRIQGTLQELDALIPEVTHEETLAELISLKASLTEVLSELSSGQPGSSMSAEDSIADQSSNTAGKE